jgi:hypothetical protein
MEFKKTSAAPRTAITTVKILAGLSCCVAAFALPGRLALGELTHFGFSQGTSDLGGEDVLRGSIFVVCAISLSAVGTYLIIKRSSTVSKLIRLAIGLTISVCIILPIGRVWHLRANTVSDAEDRRRWLQQIETENRAAGLIQDSNGNWSFQAITNRSKPTKADGSH